MYVSSVSVCGKQRMQNTDIKLDSARRRVFTPTVFIVLYCVVLYVQRLWLQCIHFSSPHGPLCLQRCIRVRVDFPPTANLLSLQASKAELYPCFQRPKVKLLIRLQRSLSLEISFVVWLRPLSPCPPPPPPRQIVGGFCFWKRKKKKDERWTCIHLKKKNLCVSV